MDNWRKNVLLTDEWYRKLLTIEDVQARNDFLWKIYTFGITREFEPTGDTFRDAWLKEICESIDRMKDSYEKKVEGGKSSGRKQAFSRGELIKLIAEGKNGREIAQIFGVDPSAIYHEPVWIDRKKNGYYKDEK